MGDGFNDSHIAERSKKVARVACFRALCMGIPLVLVIRILYEMKTVL